MDNLSNLSEESKKALFEALAGEYTGRKRLAISQAWGEWSDPRQWDNLGEFYVGRRAHNRYGIGEPVDGEEEFNEDHPDGVSLAVYLYDHSGVDIRVEGGPRRFWHHEAWDSAYIGCYHAGEEAIREWFQLGSGDLGEPVFNQAVQAMIVEVETYAAWLRGEAYNLAIESERRDGSWEVADGDEDREVQTYGDLYGTIEREFPEFWPDEDNWYVYYA